MSVASGGTLGTGLIGEGVADLITAGTSAIRGEFSWGEWGLQKAVSIFVSLVSSGWDTIKQGYQKLKEGVKQAGQIFKEGCKEGLQVAKNQLKSALTKGIGKELSSSLINAGVDKWAIEHIEKDINEKVDAALDAFLSNNILIQRGLEVDQNNRNNHWQATVLQTAMDLLQNEASEWKTALDALVQGLLSNQALACVHDLAAKHNNNYIALGGKLLVGGTPIAASLIAIQEFTSDFLKGLNETLADEYSASIESAQQAMQEQQATTEAQSVEELEEEATEALSGIDEAIVIPTCTLESGVNYSSQLVEHDLLAHKHYSPSSQVTIHRQLQTQLTTKLLGDMKGKVLRPASRLVSSIAIDKLMENQDKALQEQINKLQEKKRREALEAQEAARQARAMQQQADEAATASTTPPEQEPEIAPQEAAPEQAVQAAPAPQSKAEEEMAASAQKAEPIAQETAPEQTEEQKAQAANAPQSKPEEKAQPSTQKTPQAGPSASKSSSKPLTQKEKAQGAIHKGKAPQDPAWLEEKVQRYSAECKNNHKFKALCKQKARAEKQYQKDPNNRNKQRLEELENQFREHPLVQTGEQLKREAQQLRREAQAQADHAQITSILPNGLLSERQLQAAQQHSATAKQLQQNYLAVQQVMREAKEVENMRLTHTADDITQKAEGAFEHTKKEYPDPAMPACNISVHHAFYHLTGSTELSSKVEVAPKKLPTAKLANEMLRHCATADHWEEIPMQEAQALANQGEIVIAGAINEEGKDPHGHVVLIVPGTEEYSGNWKCKVPMSMDTGKDQRWSARKMSHGMGKHLKGKVKFFLYHDPTE